MLSWRRVHHSFDSNSEEERGINSALRKSRESHGTNGVRKFHRGLQLLRDDRRPAIAIHFIRFVETELNLNPAKFMKPSNVFQTAFAVILGGTLHTSAATIVDDTFLDGSRGQQNLPTESQWFKGGAGTLDVVAPGGPLRGDLGAGGSSSASWTTYFASSGSPLTLANTGDNLKVTWQFSLTGIGAQNNSQNFRLALVNSPESARLSADGSPGNAAYAGYGMFMNLAPALGNSNPFQLMERVDSATESALLSAGASWTGLANGATTGNTGYAEDTLYTLTLSLTLNSLGGLDIESIMSGGDLNGSGSASISYTDASPNSLSFDTFSIRPSNATGAAQIFDTSRFKVEFVAVPEPSMIALLGIGFVGLILNSVRKRR